MAKKLSSVIGIDIGSQNIKVAELKTQSKEPIISALGIIETPEGAVDHTGIFNSEAVGTALKQCLSQSGVTVAQAIVSISGQSSVLVRTLPVPRMNASELKEHMQWEINRNIPFAESNVVSDYRPLADEDPNSAEMDVVMAISPQSAIDTVVACVKRAGRTTTAIDVQPLALARSVVTSYGDMFAGKTICLVDAGHKTTSINIYKDGKLLMPRQIPLGGEMFTKAIADSQGLSVEQAEVAKRTHGRIPGGAGGGMPTQAFTPAPVTDGGFQPYNPFADDEIAPAPAPVSDDPTDMGGMTPPPADNLPVASALTPDEERIFNAFAPVLEEFLAEVRRSVDYYRSRGGDIDAIVLCGGGGQIKGFPEFLNENLGISCQSYDALRNLRLNDKKVAPGFADEHGSEFAVAVGNALHIFYE